MIDGKDKKNGTDFSKTELLQLAEKLRSLADRLEAAADGKEGWPDDEIRRIFQESDEIFSTLGNLFVNLGYAEILGKVQASWKRMSQNFEPIKEAGKEFLTVFKDAFSGLTPPGEMDKKGKAGNDER